MIEDVGVDLENRLQILHILEKHIHYVATEGTQNAKNFQKREVILSGYLIK